MFARNVVLQVITIKPFLCHQFVEGGSRYWLSRSTPILEFWNLFRNEFERVRPLRELTQIVDISNGFHHHINRDGRNCCF